MCRRERPISTTNKALRELQEWLREQKARTGLDYRALSVQAGCHATTLQRAAAGDTVPTLPAVLNYARACDASPDEARLLWKAARYQETRMARGGRGQPAPRPEFIRDFVDLSAAMVELYERAGSPPLRTMEQRAGKYGVLPRSTAHRIVTKQAVPHNLPQFQAYLKACEVPEADWSVWESAWTRAWRYEKQEEDDSVVVPVVTRDGRRATGSYLGDLAKLAAVFPTPAPAPARDVDVVEGLVSARVPRRRGASRRRNRAMRAQVGRFVRMLDSLDGVSVDPVLTVHFKDCPQLEPEPTGHVIGEESEGREEDRTRSALG
ncbi:helix-turn-helix domain-containing protein [Streptomyces fuscichromogenes]|uniref:helix-turn-helix domain-containing protein n=1 Tax=Streptomyces fuscichromogenes TaxID=1324013 RepID=UPI0037F71C49